MKFLTYHFSDILKGLKTSSDAESESVTWMEDVPEQQSFWFETSFLSIISVKRLISCTIKLQGTATKKSDANKLELMHQIFWLLYLAALSFLRYKSLLELAWSR